mgnify:CR=1 FL=1
MSLIQINDNRPDDIKAIQWLAFASNAFNVMVPFYADIETTPDYLSNTTGDVSTDNFYWSSRMIAAMADASYKNLSSILSVIRNMSCPKDTKSSTVMTI